MILIFDLDETLYLESTFVTGGFSAVSKHLEDNFNLADTYETMIFLLSKNGRGRVFDEVLKINGIYSVKNVKKCISVYRNHKPNIKLEEDSIKCLEHYKTYRKYIVTDGNKIVQRNKISALNLWDEFEKCYITRNYGIKYEKPSTYCFDLIKKRENCKYKDMAYIGDNPNKDFYNLKKLGVLTVRINRGAYKDILFEKEKEADFKINSLCELFNIIT